MNYNEIFKLTADTRWNVVAQDENMWRVGIYQLCISSGQITPQEAHIRNSGEKVAQFDRRLQRLGHSSRLLLDHLPQASFTCGTCANIDSRVMNSGKADNGGWPH